jgi:hypothetical protein
VPRAIRRRPALTTRIRGGGQALRSHRAHNRAALPAAPIATSVAAAAPSRRTLSCAVEEDGRAETEKIRIARHEGE